MGMWAANPIGPQMPENTAYEAIMTSMRPDGGAAQTTRHRLHPSVRLDDGVVVRGIERAANFAKSPKH